MSGIPQPPPPEESAPCIDKFVIQVNRDVAMWLYGLANTAKANPPYQLEDRFGYTDSDRWISNVVYGILTASEEFPQDTFLQELGPERVRVRAYLPCNYIDWLQDKVGNTKGPVIQGQGVDAVERIARAILTQAYLKRNEGGTALLGARASGKGITPIISMLKKKENIRPAIIAAAILAIEYLLDNVPDFAGICGM